MAARGRGALLRKEERAAEIGAKWRPPWKKKGLSRVDRVIAFLEYLPITKGIRARKKMKLLPDQREFIEAVYGRTKKGGRRLISVAIKSAPKGNGKTGLCAGLALCHLLGPEAEQRGEVYSASIDGVHAGRLYAEMEAIIARVKPFAARVNAQRFRKSIEVLEGDGEGSIFEALSADGRKA
jgi:phage terminase large subunit-like protein